MFCTSITDSHLAFTFMFRASLRRSALLPAPFCVIHHPLLVHSSHCPDPIGSFIRHRQPHSCSSEQHRPRNVLPLCGPCTKGLSSKYNHKTRDTDFKNPIFSHKANDCDNVEIQSRLYGLCFGVFNTREVS